MKKKPVRLAMLISGSGSTMEAVLIAWKRGNLAGIEPVGVIASKGDAKGIQKAKALGIATYVLETNKRPAQEWGNDLLALLQRLNVDWVSQNGWLPLTPLPVVRAYSGRIINQHPGPLDPGRPIDFGGKGMYGSRVTAARLMYAWVSGEGYWTEGTVHHVTSEFDKGTIVATSRLALPNHEVPTTIEKLMRNPIFLKEKTAEVQATLLAKEHALVISTLKRMGESGRVPHYRRTVPLVPKANISIAQQAKDAAITLFPHG